MEFFARDKKKLVPAQFDYNIFHSEHAAIQAELDDKAKQCNRVSYMTNFRKKIFLLFGFICLFAGTLFCIINILADTPLDLGMIILLIFGIVIFALVIIESLIKKLSNKWNHFPLRLVILLNRQGPDAAEQALSFAVTGFAGTLAGGIFPERLNFVYYDGDVRREINNRFDNKTAKWAFNDSSYAIIALTPKPEFIKLFYKKNKRYSVK